MTEVEKAEANRSSKDRMRESIDSIIPEEGEYDRIVDRQKKRRSRKKMQKVKPILQMIIRNNS